MNGKILYTVKCKIITKWQATLHFYSNRKLTGNEEGVDGDPVVLVLLVGVRASKAKAGAEGAEDVCQDTDNHQGSDAADVA